LTVLRERPRIQRSLGIGVVSDFEMVRVYGWRQRGWWGKRSLESGRPATPACGHRSWWS